MRQAKQSDLWHVITRFALPDSLPLSTSYRATPHHVIYRGGWIACGKGKAIAAKILMFFHIWAKHPLKYGEEWNGIQAIAPQALRPKSGLSFPCSSIGFAPDCFTIAHPFLSVERGPLSSLGRPAFDTILSFVIIFVRDLTGSEEERIKGQIPFPFPFYIVFFPKEHLQPFRRATEGTRLDDLWHVISCPIHLSKKGWNFDRWKGFFLPVPPFKFVYSITFSK